MAVPSFISPSTKTFLNVGRELVVGTPVVGTTTLPLEQNDYSPEDTPKFLPDEGIRGVMTPIFNQVRGVQQSTFSFGGPSYLDTEGFWLDNTFGDMTSTSNGTLGTTQAFTGTTAVGATTFSLGTSIGSVTTGSIIQITDTGPPAANEIVIATSGSNGTLINCTNNPLRFAHGTLATAQLQSTATNYTHRWTILNTGNGQPPTHTLVDYTALTPSTGARAYPSCCVSQLDFSGNTEQLLMKKVSGMGFQSAAAATTPVAQTAFTVPQANWESTMSIGGTQIYDITQWSASIKRKLQAYWTAQNSPTPFIIARGGLTISWGINWGVAENETALTEMLTSGPLAIVAALSNGLTGANELSITITTTTAQTVKAKPTRSAVLVGFDNTAEAVANATDSGGSGGIGPGSVTLVNAIAAY